MDLDDFRSVMDNAGVDVWTFIDTAILVASLDYGQELKRRRDNIVERLYATSMANKCRNCDFGGGGGEVARANGSVHEEEEEEEVREKSVNGEDDDEEDDGYDPFAGLFDDEQKSVLEIKERLEDPDLSEEDLVELLQNLDDMEITFQALQETDIGRHVNKVRKHSSNDVRTLAKKLVKKWKETVDEWVKLNPPGDLEPPSLIADEDSPQQRAIRNGNRQQMGIQVHQARTVTLASQRESQDQLLFLLEESLLLQLNNLLVPFRGRRSTRKLILTRLGKDCNKTTDKLRMLKSKGPYR
ncbi:probable mediator of RNA polymerase II transcription subunit 26c isoform X3 [Brassica napus]|uniref:probable mediator of RNA polymerase II transcription subunit 26c isoform X3 n=1 Tax=Brassica napus TaxID=3708 RepID=UPI0020786FA2|nr:probable mediator of RNA polymerase II transcription subunit 26c isoform X3 [Brassica napus]